MSEDLDIVRKAYDHYLHGRLDDLLECFCEDITWRSIGPSKSIPWAGVCQGREAVREWFGKLTREVTIEKYDVKRFVCDGDHMVVLSDVVARSQGGGPAVRFDKCDVFRVDGGAIVEFLEFYDTAAVQTMLQGRLPMTNEAAESVAASEI